MAVRMAGVEVVDRDPIELGPEVFLHLLHHLAGETAKIGQPVAVLGRDDEAELMPVLSPALQKLAAIRRISLRSVEPAPFSFPVRPVALQIAQMRVGSLAPEFQLDDPRLISIRRARPRWRRGDFDN